MTVRDATPDDVEAVVALVAELGEYEHLADEVRLGADDLRRHVFGERPVATVLVAEEEVDAGPVVVGYALCFPTFSTFLGRPGIWLEDLFVSAEHRGRGHGRALLDAVAQRSEGRVEWAVLDWNEPAQRFYRRWGAAPLTGWTVWRRGIAGEAG